MPGEAVVDAKQPSAPPPRGEPALLLLLQTLVCEDHYQAATGPECKGATFARAQVQAAFVHITLCIGVVALYYSTLNRSCACFLSFWVGTCFSFGNWIRQNICL